jgi:hypothetical protein
MSFSKNLLCGLVLVSFGFSTGAWAGNTHSLKDIQKLADDLAVIKNFVQLKRDVDLKNAQEPIAPTILSRATALNAKVQPDKCNIKLPEEDVHHIGEGDQQVEVTEFEVSVDGPNCPIRLYGGLKISFENLEEIHAHYLIGVEILDPAIAGEYRAKTMNQEADIIIKVKQSQVGVNFGVEYTVIFTGEHLDYGKFESTSQSNTQFAVLFPFDINGSVHEKSEVHFQGNVSTLEMDSTVTGFNGTESYSLNKTPITKEEYKVVQDGLNIVGVNDKEELIVPPLQCTSVITSKSGDNLILESCGQSLSREFTMNNKTYRTEMSYIKDWMEFKIDDKLVLYFNYDEDLTVDKVYDELKVETTCKAVPTCESK